jgi:Sigma-70 region 2
MQADGDVVRFPMAEERAPQDFAAFFAEEHRGPYKALYFVTGNRADAAELVQDAFLKLWERWDRTEPDTERPGSRMVAGPSVFRGSAPWRRTHIYPYPLNPPANQRARPEGRRAGRPRPRTRSRRLERRR